MRTAVPRSTESAADLKQRRPRDHDGRTHPRRPLLSLLASAHAATRHGVAHRLGVRRTTVGRWVARYETGGTTALLAIHTPLGNSLRSRQPSSRAARRHCGTHPALVLPKNCGSGWSARITCGSRTNHAPPSCANAARPRSRFHGRATHKKPAAVATCQAALAEHLYQFWLKRPCIRNG